MARCRVLVAQGPIQLIAALTVWAHEAEAGMEAGEDILLLGDFAADEWTSRQIETVCRQIARAWSFAHIAATYQTDALFYSGCLSFEQYSARIADVVGATQVDAVYVCRNMQLLNETILHLFKDSRKICYGDGFGHIDINNTIWVRPIHAAGYVSVDEIACVMPLEYYEGVWGKLPLTIVSPRHFTALMKRIPRLIDGVEETADGIAGTAREHIVVMTLGRLLFSGLVASTEDEMSLYLDCVLPLLDLDTTVVVKPHPRERTDQALILVERLRSMGYDARRLTDLSAVPIECYAFAIRVRDLVSVFSSSAPSWRLLQQQTDLRIGVSERATDRYLLSPSWFDVKSFAPKFFVLASMATEGWFQPISIRAIRESLALAPPAPISLRGVARAIAQSCPEPDPFLHAVFLEAVLAKSARYIGSP